MDFDTVIHNGTLVTADERMQVIQKGWIGIRKGLIRAIDADSSGTPPPAARLVIDAAGGIVMPGLVNTHTHLPMSLFRGLADDLPLIDWLNDHIFPAEARFIKPDTVRWGTLLACAEMLLSGTTCCCGGYFHEDAVARAVAETGLRAVLAQGVIDFPGPRRAGSRPERRPRQGVCPALERPQPADHTVHLLPCAVHLQRRHPEGRQSGRR